MSAFMATKGKTLSTSLSSYTIIWSFTHEKIKNMFLLLFLLIDKMILNHCFITHLTPEKTEWPMVEYVVGGREGHA
jgi:hypothetical protein